MPCVSGERLPLRVLTTADGLSNNVVNRIVSDSRGFVWLCTREGLSRFDGHGFTSFGLGSGLPSAVVHDLAESPDGHYWIATADGLVLFDPRANASARGGGAGPASFARYAPSADHRARSANVLLDRRDGGLWVGTGLGLYRVGDDHGRWQWMREDLLDRTPAVNALAEDPSGALWVGADDGLYRWRRGVPAERWTAAHGLPANRVLSVYVDRQQRVWVGTTNGLVRLVSAPRADAFITDRVDGAGDALRGRWVWQVRETREGTMWVATDGGLARRVSGRHGDRDTFRPFGMASGLPSHHVSALAEDRNGRLWIGTRHGAARLLSSRFTIFDGGDGVQTAATLALTQQGDVLVLEAVNQWRVNRYDGHAFVKSTLPSERLETSWGWNQMFVVDRAGTSWLASRSGVWRFRGRIGVDPLARAAPIGRYTSRDGLATDVVLRLSQDSRGDVWIATAGEGERRNGLSRWDHGTGRLTHYTERDGLPPLDQFYVSALAEDRAGDVWVGLSGEGGLARFRQGRFVVFAARDGVPAGTIRNLLLDSMGRLWAASYRGGLISVEAPSAGAPTFTRYSVDDGLSSNELGAIVEDADGRIYAGTARGLDVVDPVSRRVQTYLAAGGLPPGEAQAAIRDRSGALWFTYLTGVVRLAPGTDRPPDAPQVVITGVRLSGRPLHLSSVGERSVPPVVLPHTDNAVDVDFVAPGFGPRDARFQVTLEGGTTSWTPPSDRLGVSFANLGPGQYRLLVRAVNATAGPGGPASFAFTIQPPVWRRWWFVASSLLAASALVWSGYRIRRARRDDLLALRTRIARDLHDDIGANLTRIAILTEVARHHVGPASPADRQLDAIASVARESVASMGDIVWTVSPERDTIGDLAAKVRAHAGEVLVDRGIVLTMDVPDMAESKVGGDIRRDVYLIAKEAVTNAARHSRCGAVAIALALEAGRLTLTVSDDGVGFDPVAAAATGHGLGNMRRRAARRRATFEILSSPGGGTRVRVEVPLGDRRR